MSRSPRNPRPPGNVQVICTGRGRHSLVSLRRLQLVRDGDRVRVLWDRREGPPPVTGYRDADGYRTFVLACGTCGRAPKFREERLVEFARVLAVHQGLADDHNTPITLDISATSVILV